MYNCVANFVCVMYQTPTKGINLMCPTYNVEMQNILAIFMSHQKHIKLDFADEGLWEMLGSMSKYLSQDGMANVITTVPYHPA